MARGGESVQDFSIKLEAARKMKTIFALQERLISTWFEAFELQLATVSTIYARLPIIAAAASGLGDTNDHRETQNMVTEKLLAVQEGAEAGALQTAKATWKVLNGDAHPMAVAGHMMDVAAAATRPARKKVLANAQRLSSR
jgi:hypothetical protein